MIPLNLQLNIENLTLTRIVLFTGRAAILILLMSVAAPISVLPQEQTVGLFLNDSVSFVGYTLFAPMRYTTTYLINNEGLLVQSWDSDYRPGQSVYLLDNGNLLRTAQVIGNPTFSGGGSGGRVQEFNWGGNLIWEFEYSSDQYMHHHDIEPLPNGNVLMIAWEYKSYAEALAAGRDPNLLPDGELWPDHIIEVEPTGETSGDIVWEWHVWDHLIQDYDSTKDNYGVVSDHPELIDVNYVRSGPGAGKADWNHINSVDYNAGYDQIILSVHDFDEIWVIDHSTTTEEAASHSGGNSGKGGDLLYRWGNPEAYRTGNAGDQKFFGQHDARWIESGYPGEGNILVFNNGQGRPEGNYSTVDEIVPPVDSIGHYYLAPDSAYGPEEQTWIYMAENPADFYAQNISGAQRLPNGNTLICDGPHGTFLEVTPDTDIVWLYVNPVTEQGPLTQGDSIPQGPQGWTNNVSKISRYAPDFPGFAGHDLTPGNPIELYPNAVDEPATGNIPRELSPSQNYPNPFNLQTIIHYQLPKAGDVQLKVYNLLGQEVKTLVNEFKSAGLHSVVWNGTDNHGKEVSSGIYLHKLQIGDDVEAKKMTLIK